MAYIDSLHLAEIRASDVEIIQLHTVDDVPDWDAGEGDEPLPWEET